MGNRLTGINIDIIGISTCNMQIAVFMVMALQLVTCIKDGYTWHQEALQEGDINVY